MPLLPAALGIHLWLVTLVVPLGLCLRLSPPAALFFVVLPLCPAVLLFSLRHPGHPLSRPALLLAVPLLCFLPVADGPLADAALHPRPTVVLQIAALLSYLLSACLTLSAAGPKEAAPEARVPLSGTAEVPRRWRRRIAIYRFLFGLSIALPALLFYAIALFPPTLLALRLSFHTPARVGAVQAALTAAAALLWLVAFYFCVKAPLRGHLEQDRETVAHLSELRRIARRGRPRPQFYVAMALALFSMILLIYRSLHP